MSKHDRSKQRYPAQVRHSVRPAPAPTLDQPTDVLTFDDHERTEIHSNLVHPQLASPRARAPQTAAPHEETFNAADERTEIQGNIDIDAARALARARFGTGNPNTFDEDERTEYQANPLHAKPQPRHTPQAASSPAAQPRTRFQTQGPRQAIAPVQEPRTPQPSPHPVTQAHHTPPSRTSAAHPRVHAPRPTTAPHARTSSTHPAVTHSPQPQPHTGTSTLEERTEPAQEIHYHPPAPHAQPAQALHAEPVHAPAPTAQQASSFAPTMERQPLSSLPMGPVNLESKSSLFDVKSLQKVAFLKEETGVEFDLLSMSSPNLNALVLAMGAQELAPELLDENEHSDTITPLAHKWGDPRTPASRAMRINYALWGGLVGLLMGFGLTVLLGAFTTMTLSSLGGIKYVLWTLFAAGLAIPCALKPRAIERTLLGLKPLPFHLPAPPHDD